MPETERVLSLSGVDDARPTFVIPVRAIQFVQITDTTLTVFLVGTTNTITTNFARWQREAIERQVEASLSGTRE